MNTQSSAAARHRWLAVPALLILSILAAPAMAEHQCNAKAEAVIAVPNLTVAESTGGVATVVTLNGSASKPTTSNNQHPTFSWTYLGSTPKIGVPPVNVPVTLQNATARIATFTAPDVAGPTALNFRLTVTCGTGQNSTHSADAVVNITNVVTNAAPVPSPASVR